MKHEWKWMTESEKQNRLRDNALIAAFAPKNYDNILEDIQEYYDRRGLKWPTTEEAILWANTEAGEVAEQLVNESGGWIRNNPDEDPGYSEDKLMEELADQVFMLLVAGMVSGYDLLDIMRRKFDRKLKLKELNND